MPPPTLSPPALKFLIIDFSITCGVMHLTFWCRTDVACHLYLHLATLKPIFRRIPFTKRGASIKMSSLTCFVEVDLIDQVQPGDTFEHTFIVPLTAYNVWHYWYLTGTQGGIPMTSVSQIFQGLCQLTSAPPVTIYLYPDYHPEVATVDGHVYRAAFETWTQITSRPGIIASDNYVGLLVSMKASTAANKYAWLYRSLLLFNTTEIPAGSIIDAAQLRLYCYAKNQNGFPLASLVVVKSSPLSNTALLPADYQNIYSSWLSSTPLISSIGVASFVYLPLNEAGRAQIVPQGITKLGLREAIYDAGGAEPPWAYNVVAQILFRSRDYLKPNTTWAPQLMVTYRPPI